MQDRTVDLVPKCDDEHPLLHGSHIRSPSDQLLAAIDASRIGVWEWNAVTGQTSFNAMWFCMLGFESGELPEQLSTWEERLHSEDRAEVEDALRACLAGATPRYLTVHRLRHKDGRWIWVRDAGIITQRSDDGSPLILIGTHVEVTNLKEAGIALMKA